MKDSFIIIYEFKAPQKVVFNAFSTKKAMGEWWGPVEMKNTAISLDFKKGGAFLFKMEGPGVVNYGRLTFGEIKPYELIEFTSAFADVNGKIIKPPFDIALPSEILYRLKFSEKGGVTTITLTGEPVNATPEEVQTFISIKSSMEEGFGGSFRKLEAFLSKHG